MTISTNTSAQSFFYVVSFKICYTKNKTQIPLELQGMVSISNVLLGFVTRVQPTYLQSLLKVGQYWQYDNKPKRSELFFKEFLIFLSGGFN